MNEERTWTGNSEVDAAIVMLDRIDCSPEDDSRVDAVEATLRRLHARVQELEAMLEAVGAGGVSAQRVTQGKDHFAQDSKMVAAPQQRRISMSKHTQWTLAERNGRIYFADRENMTIANIARSSDGDYSPSNARRLVACWNACIGISTENLEDNIPILEMVKRFHKTAQ